MALSIESSSTATCCGSKMGWLSPNSSMSELRMRLGEHPTKTENNVQNQKEPDQNEINKTSVALPEPKRRRLEPTAMPPIFRKPWASVLGCRVIPTTFHQQLNCCSTSVGHGTFAPDGDEYAEKYSRDNADLQGIRLFSQQHESPRDLKVLDLYFFLEQLGDVQVADRPRAAQDQLTQNGFQTVGAFIFVGGICDLGDNTVRCSV